MSFRARLLVLLVALTVFALGIAFGSVALWQQSARLASFDANLLEVAHAEAEHASRRSGKEHVFRDYPGPNDMSELNLYGVIYADSGEVLTATEKLAGKAPPLAAIRGHLEAPYDWRVDGIDLRVALVPVPGRHEVMLLGTSTSDLEDEGKKLLRVMGIACAVAVLWAGALAYWLVRRMTAEHARIASVARQVSAGDLTARVALKTRDEELAQLGRDVDEMIERLGLLVTSQQRFIAHAAHELRTPLTTAYGQLQHALRRDRSAAEYKEAIEEALHATRRLKALAEDLLTLARLGGGGEDAPAPFGLRAVVDDAVRSAAELSDERDVTVAVEGDDVELVGRARDAERMVRNLVENAVSHSPRGARVRVSLESDAGRVRLTVSDEGPGVSPEDAPRIFEPFYRGAASRAQARSGSGLGLGIARDIARAHGGDLVLDQGTAPGARFVATLAVRGK